MKPHFTTPLRVELVDHKDQGTWKLLEPLRYWSPAYGFLEVPTGFETDFASVPRAPLAYWLTGNTAHAPATLHDYLCRKGAIPRREADKVFREAMEAIGLPGWRSWAMFRAVRAYSETVANWFRE